MSHRLYEPHDLAQMENKIIVYLFIFNEVVQLWEHLDLLLIPCQGSHLGIQAERLLGTAYMAHNNMYKDNLNDSRSISFSELKVRS